MSIGVKIRAHRKRLKLSQEKLGKMLGVSKAAVSQWEIKDDAKRTTPELRHLTVLAKIFGISLSELAGISGNGDSIDAELQKLDPELAEVLSRSFRSQISDFKKLQKS